jgi:hypothetical protein
MPLLPVDEQLHSVLKGISADVDEDVGLSTARLKLWPVLVKFVENRRIWPTLNS